jgi:hypothetical protein
MLGRVAASTRILLLFLLFTVGIGGHAIAAAIGAMPSELPAVASFAPLHYQGAGSGCGNRQTGQDCGSLGQCILAMPPTSASEFLSRTATMSLEESALLLDKCTPNHPYRPPAIV